jgi:predicted nucleic acid-binding Zn ribbon protein
MDRRLLWVGSMSILVTVALWVADAASWIPRSTDDRWSGLTLKVGVVALAGALVLRLLAPVAGLRHKGRCAVCGQSTERGRVYCLDHLQETVNATRDLTHTTTASRPKTVR